jgi:Secretion system C-terminal sorting domain/HYDIN/CFA65/VesB-like, Ig-like domain
MKKIKIVVFAILLVAFALPAMAQHFVSVDPTGLPYSIAIQHAEHEENLLVADDEIAVFDGDLCVGMVIVEDEWPLVLTAWESDAAMGLDGFVFGNTMTFKIYIAAQDIEFDCSVDLDAGDGTFGNGFGTNITSMSTILPIPDIDFSVNGNDYGDVNLNSTVTFDLEILNVGAVDLVVDSILSSSPVVGFSEVIDVTISPEGSIFVTTSFRPEETVIYDETITVYSNDPDEAEKVFTVTGRGVVLDEPNIDLDPRGFDFEIAYLGTSEEVTVTITNIGLQDLVVDSIRSNNDLFVLTATDDVTLAPDETNEFVVTYTPLDETVAEGEITIYSNDPDASEVLFIVNGEGQIARPENLVGNVNNHIGVVTLTWDFPLEITTLHLNELDEFLNFVIYRDDDSLGVSTETSFSDTLTEYGTYSYKVMAHYDDMDSDFSDPVDVVYEEVSAPELGDDATPVSWEISSIYPNPFNSQVNVIMSVPSADFVNVTIVDILGRKVATLNSSHLNAGYKTFNWHANGPTGIYFVIASNSQGWQGVQRMVYVK